MKKQYIIMIVMNIILGILAVFPLIIGFISLAGGMGLLSQPANSDLITGILILVIIIFVVLGANLWIWKKVDPSDKRLLLIGFIVFIVTAAIGYFTL